MFVKIMDNNILEAKQIKRIKKEEEIVFEMTDEYSKFINENRNIFAFFNGKKYTDRMIDEKYKIVIYTYDFEELYFEYPTIEERNKEFDKIWNRIKINKEVILDDKC